MAAYLTLPDGKQLPVEDGMVIGRDKRVHVVITDTKASRKHARVISQGGVVEIEDLDSSNGTLLNGKPVQKRMLRDGDEIPIGTTTITYRERAEAAAPAVGSDFGAGEDLFGDEPASSGPSGPVEEVEVIREAPRHELASSEPKPEPAVADLSEQDSEPDLESIVEVRAPKETETAPAAQDEVLEFADDEVVVVKKTAADLAPKKAKSQPAKTVPDREGGVLQFHKVEQKGGLAVQDLGQMSGVMRFVLTIVALAAAAGLFYLAMQMAS